MLDIVVCYLSMLGVFEGLYKGSRQWYRCCHCVPDWPISILGRCIHKTSVGCQSFAQVVAFHTNSPTGGYTTSSHLRKYRWHISELIFLCFLSLDPIRNYLTFKRTLGAIMAWHFYEPSGILSNWGPASLYFNKGARKKSFRAKRGREICERVWKILIGPFVPKQIYPAGFKQGYLNCLLLIKSPCNATDNLGII